MLSVPFARGTQKITLRFGKATYYKKSECPAAKTALEVVSSLRYHWVNEHSVDDNGFEKLPGSGGFGNAVPIVIALSIASSISSTKKKKAEFTFYPGDLDIVPPELTWIGPIRTEPKRTYDELALEFSSQGRHTPYLIRRMLKSRSQASKLKAFFEKAWPGKRIISGCEDPELWKRGKPAL